MSRCAVAGQVGKGSAPAFPRRAVAALAAVAVLLAVLGAAAVDGAQARVRRAPVPDPLEQALRRHVETLASDEFGGREPGTDGETRTLKYLASQWFDIGLESGTNDPGHAWFAPVELVERVPDGSRAQFARGKRRIVVPAQGVFVVTSGLRSLIENAPLVFVGRDAEAAVGRTELAGRIAVVRDSERATPSPAPARADAGGGPAPDRAGRLLDAGAAAVITVLDGDRSLDDVIAHRRRAGYALAGQRLGGDIEGYVTPEAALELLAGLRDGAAAGRPRPLGLTGTLEATSRETRINTHNLIGRIEGRRPDAGAVVLAAHWDHFGRCAEPPAEHLICNGAVDNASGLAVITEVARILSAGKPLERDVYVLATTGEELGLLGALAFAENPPVPLDRIVAVFNVDSTGLVPAGQPVSVVGAGLTPLDPGIAQVVRALRMKLAGGDSANAWVRRQDSWVFIQHDVPAVMVSTAYSDPVRLERFMDERYHRTGDVSARVEYGGMADDVRLQVELVRYFADARTWPGRPVQAAAQR